ncbi:tlde1 domain-containing protein, partial [Bacillus sp. SIMBA_031]
MANLSGVRRGNFRLHPASGAGLSFGCITLKSLADFRRLRQTLL